MRREIISCDTCCATHDAEYHLPKAWITTTQGDPSYVDTVQHFCSFKCLIDWAQKHLIVKEEQCVSPKNEVKTREPLFSESEMKAINDLDEYIGNKDWRF